MSMPTLFDDLADGAASHGHHGDGAAARLGVSTPATQEAPGEAAPRSRPRARSTDPRTSHQAAEHVLAETVRNGGALEALIVRAFIECGPMCDDELVACEIGYPPSVKTARSRLSKPNSRRGPVLVDTGERQLSARGCEQIVWGLRVETVTDRHGRVG